MGLVTTLTYTFTQRSRVLSALSKALLSIAAAVSVYTETVGRARAAAELTRMGYHVEAKRLMLGEDLS